MRKLFSILFVILPFLVTAQDLKLLNIEEDTEGGIGVYPCGERHEAMVQFVISEPFGLEFRSNYDKELNIQMDSVAGKKTYSIVFVTQAPGVSYDGRRLTVMAKGFRNHVMTLNLRDKQKFIYKVSDPYSALRSPYFVYQDKGNDLFYQGQYQGAKDCYQMIRVCPEYQMNKADIDARIQLCDSMIYWSAQALRLEQFAQFQDAVDIYYKMYLYNSGSKEIGEKIGHCQAAYSNDCNNEFTLAEHYMSLGQTELARASYQRLVDKKCTSYMAEATAALSNLQRHDNKVAQHARCFFYDFGGNMPIGFTYAQCYTKNRRSSGYITFRMNKSDVKCLMGTGSTDVSFAGTWPTYSETFPKMYSSDLRDCFDDESLKWVYNEDYEKNSEDYYQPKELDFETNLSFGWTIRLWRYFFMHLGTGYHGGGFYTFDSNDASKAISEWKQSHNAFNPATDPFNTWDEDLRHDCMQSNWFNGAVGEAGLIVKVWRLNAKATYQYTYWLNKGHYKEFLDNNTGKFYVGFGFNW